ncbi:hypothetical protein Dsin_028601 [Dipteronia sinensis]|uniref:RNase H type-1 domain-containing protein n=1 Tax=Dipteronia sinensis TaxID=43782 RepID=A0AAE0DUK4_9ROSI|nr:hypothetical protein Dsin_028601 [Dipteronia sinensis]
MKGLLCDDKGERVWKTSINRSNECLTELQASKDEGDGSREHGLPTVIKWETPLKGCYKINTDAALNVKDNRVRVGLVIRDSRGQVMATSVQCVEAGYSPRVAEAMAFLLGITFVEDAGLLPAAVEFDALRVLNLIIAGNPTSTYILG